jgi:hypothetical protein
MKRLFLPVYSSSEVDNADCGYAIVTVTEALIETVYQRHENALYLKARDNELHAGVWYDTSAFYVDDFKALETLEKLYGAKACDLILSEGEPWVEPHSFAPVVFEALHTNTDKMYVDESSVWWGACPQHEIFTLNTGCIAVHRFLSLLSDVDVVNIEP